MLPHPRASVSVRLIPALLLVLLPCSPLRVEVHAAPADYEPAKAELGQRLGALRRMYQETDWPAQSPTELGRRLKHDPHACDAFLRRGLRYEPYAGVLRGATGTLTAGGGNSADLCLLLREMLAGAEPKLTFRFATAQLDQEQAKKLVDGAVARPPAGTVVVPADKQAQAPPPAAAKSDPEQVGGVKSVLDRAKADLRQIDALLGAAGAGSDDRDAAIAHARQHVWLQVTRDGKTETLDPVAALPLPEGAQVLDELPAAWTHVLHVRVELERLSNGAAAELKRETILEKDWPAAALSGSPLELVIVPAELSVNGLLDPKHKSDTLAEQAKKFEKFSVALGVGDAEPEKQFSLSATAGAVTEAEKPAGPTGIGSFDPFKSSPTRGKPPAGGEPKAGGGEVSGLFVTFAFNGPGGTWSAQRALLDRIGPAARAAGGTPKIAADWKNPQRLRLALVQRHQILVPSGPIGLARAARDAVSCLVEHKTLEQSLELQYGRSDPAKAMDAVVLPSLPTDLIAVNDGAMSLTQMMSASAGECLVFTGVPNLYLRSETLQLVAGQAVLHSGADLVRNEITAIGPAAARVRRAHGVLASELEGLSIHAPHGGTAPLWAADVLRAVESGGLKVKVLRAPGDEKQIDADPDAKAVMAELLGKKNVLLAPEKSLALPASPGAPAGDRVHAVAWWTIDERGHVLATSADGRGQASEGEMVLTGISIPMVKRCMKFVACFNKGVAGGGGMRQSGGECLGHAIRDYVKDTLDAAIKQFITSPIKNAMEEAAAGQFGEYWELYKKAQEAKEKYEQAMSIIEDPAGAVPGVNEGRDAANAGREIGSSLGFRMYLMLTMGRDIAEYASKP